MQLGIYQHQDVAQNTIDLPVGKVVCIGRNYLDHIRELDNEVPEQALLFMKPATAVVPLSSSLTIPVDLGLCHNEVELALLVNKVIVKGADFELDDVIWGCGLALDLTLRELQSQLKRDGHPWERAKAFDGSCPVSRFVPLSELEVHSPLENTDFSLSVNSELRQQGNTANMMRSIKELIKEIVASFTLIPGDIILTGTPSGVGPLKPGDKLALSLANSYKFRSEIK